ncbi:MAG: SusC/RagA family TonB-linked outer membrane protein [Bacteroidota bacterium]
MKLTLLGLLIGLMQVSASVYSQATKFSFNLEQKQVAEVLREIEDNSNFRFFYQREQVDVEKVITINAEENSVEEILSAIFKDEGVGFKVLDNNLILIAPEKMDFSEIQEMAQQKSVSGKVTDERGLPLPGVAIVVKGTSNGTVTSVDGEYEISVDSDESVLVFSFVGMKTKEVVVGNQAVIDITMDEAVTAVDEIIVTALGLKRQEKALGYSVQKVDGEELQQTKGTYIATSITGKISGLWVKNSTEFNEAPSISLRGETPLLVIDGVPYSNMALTDIAADNIQSIDVLKGGTASALYGYRGGSGAIIVTTKNGKESKGLTVQINSNNMVASGFLALPEVQSSYAHGINGAIATDYVWGPKLDIGETALQWDPVSKSMKEMPLISSGKDNFRNFLETGIISNNNISVAQSGENGSFRISLNHIYNKGQYPNLEMNTSNFTVGGEMKLGEKFHLESSMGYNREMTPQTTGRGYGDQGYIYQILMWTGPDYDLLQYRDYWITENEQQNWHYSAWYDNPYLIAYEKLKGQLRNKMNANVTATYSVFPGAKIILRNGFDMYSNEYTVRNPINVNSGRGGFNKKGVYKNQVTSGWSINSDLIFTYNKTISKDFRVDALAGGNIYRYTDKNLETSTQNGLVIPGFYSLKNSRDPVYASSSVFRRQVNSVFGKLTLSYKNAIYIDATARNDWSSTQSKDTRSFFYPSVGTSVILSEFFNQPSWLDMWKIRSSWTLAKSPLGIYENNQAYATGQANWNGLLYADYPNELFGGNVFAEATRTVEVGTSAYFLKRFKFDFAYYNKLYYNQQRSATISSASGFTSTLINTEEEHVRRGMEFTVEANLIKKRDFSYSISANWSKSHRYYHKLDPVYSSDNLWTKEDGRVDTYVDRYWLTDSEGNIVHKSNGEPWKSDYRKVWGNSDPDFIWGLGNKITWKRFNLNFNFDGRVGGIMYNRTAYKMWDTGSHPDSDNEWRYDEVVNNQTNYIGEGVKVVSGEVVYDNYGLVVSDNRVFATNDKEISYQSYARDFAEGRLGNVSGTFFKLRDASLGYNLPIGVAEKIGAKNMYISLTGQNLLLWTKEFRYADPDSGNDSDLSSPSVRYLGMNVNLTF